jgi:hypothetical protein
MGSYTPTPDYGRRLLPVLIDEIARDDPDRACFSLPRTDSDLSQGYEDVTYATFANAINQLAWLIERTFGRSDKFDAIAYLGTPDIRYHFMQIASAKTGYQGRSFHPVFWVHCLTCNRSCSVLTHKVFLATWL